MNEETWYAIQVTREGDVNGDDWCASGTDTYHKLENARRAMLATFIPGFKFRLVKRTLTEEVVE